MIENVLNEIKTLIDQNLDRELEKQDGEYDDTITLDKVLADSIIIGDRELPPTLPAIVLSPESADFEPYATSKKDVLHTIAIGVVVTDSIEENSYRKIWRTLRAVENVLEIQCKSGSGPIVDYITTDITYDVGPFSITNVESLTKAGILTGEFRERLDAYTSTQI